MRPRTTLLLTFVLLVFTSVFAQEDRLYNLDSLAFAALESNQPNTEAKANELLAAGKKEDAPLYQINAFTILGIINKNKGYYVTAVEFYNKALAVAESANDQARVSACYNNIGTVYQIQENYEKALPFFLKSLEIEEQLDNPLQKSIRLYNIGEMYREMDSLTLALANFNGSLLIEKKYKNNEGIAYALLGITEVYLKLDKVTDAQLTLEDVERYSTDADVEIQILYNILYADLYRKQDRLEQALKVIKKAKKISELNDFKVHLPNILEKEVAINDLLDKKYKSEKKQVDSSDAFNYWWSALALPFIYFLFKYIPPMIGKRKNDKDNKKHEKLKEQWDPKSTFQLENDAGKILLKIETARIIGFEANDNYVIAYHLSYENTLQKSMERASLKKVEEIIGDHPDFFRVHKSHIINKKYVQSVGGKAQAYKINMQSMKASIPVSRSFDIAQITG